jgi:hypothetical protein
MFRPALAMEADAMDQEGCDPGEIGQSFFEHGLDLAKEVAKANRQDVLHYVTQQLAELELSLDLVHRRVAKHFFYRGLRAGLTPSPSSKPLVSS